MHVSVVVNAGSKKEFLLEEESGRMVAYVREKPERGAANRRVLEMLADRFNVVPQSVRIVKGHKTPHKLFKIVM